MTKEVLLDAAEACMNDCCAACPLFRKMDGDCSCIRTLLAAIKDHVVDETIKCSDPRITHEYGRGNVLHVTLQDEGRKAGEDFVKKYTGGYIELNLKQRS